MSRLRTATGLTDSRNVAVTVLNVNEDGSVALSHPQPEVGTGITATLTDPDKVFNGRNVQNLSPRWQWYHDEDTAATSSGARSRTYTPHASDINKRSVCRSEPTQMARAQARVATSTNSLSVPVRAATPDDDEPAFTDDTGSGITKTIPEDHRSWRPGPRSRNRFRPGRRRLRLRTEGHKC